MTTLIFDMQIGSGNLPDSLDYILINNRGLQRKTVTGKNTNELANIAFNLILNSPEAFFDKCYVDPIGFGIALVDKLIELFKDSLYDIDEELFRTTGNLTIKKEEKPKKPTLCTPTISANLNSDNNLFNIVKVLTSPVDIDVDAVMLEDLIVDLQTILEAQNMIQQVKSNLEINF